MRRLPGTARAREGAARPESAAEREQRELAMAMRLSLAESKRQHEPELAMAMRLSLRDDAERQHEGLGTGGRVEGNGGSMAGARAAPQTVTQTAHRRDVPALPTQQQLLGSRADARAKYALVVVCKQKAQAHLPSHRPLALQAA